MIFIFINPLDPTGDNQTARDGEFLTIDEKTVSFSQLINSLDQKGRDTGPHDKFEGVTFFNGPLVNLPSFFEKTNIVEQVVFDGFGGFNYDYDSISRPFNVDVNQTLLPTLQLEFNSDISVLIEDTNFSQGAYRLINTDLNETEWGLTIINKEAVDDIFEIVRLGQLQDIELEVEIIADEKFFKTIGVANNYQFEFYKVVRI